MAARARSRRRAARMTGAVLAALLMGVPTAAVAASTSTGAAASTPRSAAASTSTAASTASSAPTATAAATSGAGAVSPGVTTNPLSGGVSPVSPLATTSSTTPTVLNNSTAATAGNSNLSGADAIAIVIGAVVVLGGIAFFIWRDARRRAPVGADERLGDGRRTGSKPPPKPRKLSPAERKRRKRGKAR